MTSVPHIHQSARSSRREQTELNWEVITHYKQPAQSYPRIWWLLYFIKGLAKLPFSGFTVSPRRVVKVSCIIHNILIFQLMLLSLVNICLICMLLSEIQHVMAYPV